MKAIITGNEVKGGIVAGVATKIAELGIETLRYFTNCLG